MKYTLLLSIIFSLTSYAKFDFSYGASAASYPNARGEAYLETGYSIPIWGTAGKGVMYGMIRPSLGANSSVVVNSYDARVTLYPISFIGIGIGRNENFSDYDEYQYFDCTQLRCKGDLKKEYGFIKMALGYEKFKVTGSYYEFENTYNDPAGTLLPVAEYSYILGVNPKFEKQIKRSYFAGYQLDKSIIGVYSNNVEFLESDKNFKLNLLIYQFPWKVFKVGVGAGSLQSSDQENGFNAILRITHTLAPSMALF